VKSVKAKLLQMGDINQR
jgi:hypothetical protein